MTAKCSSPPATNSPQIEAQESQPSYTTENMTNERAIKIVSVMTEENTKEDVVAKVFACEDILETDVLDWVKMPMASHLNQFIEHNNSTATRFIDDRCDMFEYDDGVRIEMHNLRDKMESTMIAMIKYASIFETISKETESER